MGVQFGTIKNKYLYKYVRVVNIIYVDGVNVEIL